MQRAFLSLLTGSAAILLSAQTITSVQDGAWSDPATWDCNCVPPVPADMVVMHNVDLAGGLTFSPSLTILPSGHLQQVSQGFIYSQGPMIVAGTLSSPGFLAPGCPVILSGSIFAESLYLGGGMQMMGGFVQVTGNFTPAVGMTVDGDGQICVGDSSNIQGPLTGTIDICDLSPTTTVPPFVDSGANFIGPNITFCQGSACSASVIEMDHVTLTATPNPATDHVRVAGVKGAVRAVVLVDLAGRTTPVGWRSAGDGSILMELDGIPAGLYLVRLTDASGVHVVRLQRA